MSALHAPESRGPETVAPGPGYETRDVSARPILWAGFALVAVAIAVHFGMWWVLDVLLERQRAAVATDRPLARELRRTTPPEPRLQASPRADLLELRAWEDRQLTTYAWVARDGGVVRIPVERAMEMLLKRGVPARQVEPEASR